MFFSDKLFFIFLDLRRSMRICVVFASFKWHTWLCCYKLGDQKKLRELAYRSASNRLACECLADNPTYVYMVWRFLLLS